MTSVNYESILKLLLKASVGKWPAQPHQRALLHHTMLLLTLNKHSFASPDWAPLTSFCFLILVSLKKAHFSSLKNVKRLYSHS